MPGYKTKPLNQDMALGGRKRGKTGGMNKNSNESLRPEQESGILGSHSGDLNLH